jgi:hypothetical protein
MKATAKVAVVRPPVDKPSVHEGAKPAESPSDANTHGKTPGTTATPIVTSAENAAHATADMMTTAGHPKHATASPAPEAGQIRNKSAPQIEQAGKRRTNVADEKEAEAESTVQAKSSQANPQLTHASPSASIEFKASDGKPLPSADHRNTDDSSSQTSGIQSPAGQPHAIGAEFQQTVLPTTDRPTVFVPTNTFLPTNEAAASEAAAPSPVAVERAGLIDRAIEDPGLSVNVMPHSAHLSITGDAGDLALHVRVRDGSADVNVSGSMAPLFDAKAPEVRTVLAGEGLNLGSFATDQRGGSQGQQGQPESTPKTNDPLPLPPPRRASTAAPEVQFADDRRIHVTA